MPAFVPAKFPEPAISPDTATLFRRTPYISPAEYRATPTAVAINNLVPGGSEAQQEAALAGVIARASDWVDTICFHRADGTLAASPSTESGWIRPRDNGTLQLICNFKPVLEVTGLAIGSGPGALGNIGQSAANTLTISGQTIQLPSLGASLGISGISTMYPFTHTVGGRVYAVWTYVNGYPHTYLAEEADKGDTTLVVGPGTPGGASVYGIYPGTQLTIHDEFTEVVVVTSVEEAAGKITLNLAEKLLYDHETPPLPNAVRVSAVPWVVEQACISLVSNLIKMRGTRAMVIPSSPAKAAAPPKQTGGQVGAQDDFEAAYEMLLPFIVPVLRST